MTVAPKDAPLIDVRDANLFLQSGESSLHILNDITFRVDSSEVVSIAGPSGSGKTSLLMILSGLERATSGAVKIAGHDFSGIDEDELAILRRKNLGIVFQNFHLIPSLSALENVTLALEIAETGMPYKQMRETAQAALDEVGLGDRLTHLPNALSGGEQQRVGLARAVVTRPRLLLADEPTGNLDQDTGAKIIELMFDLARKHDAAVVMITHDPALAERADRRLWMNRGQLSDEERADDTGATEE